MLTLARRNALPALRAANASSSSTVAGSSAEAAESAPTPRRRRARDTNANLENVDLVAPPDPLSNMRPILYASPRRRPSNSPYSASEFPAEMSGKEATQAVREMEWRMMRERVDVANHRFWASTNASFQQHLAARLASLPPASDPPTDADLAARDAVLTTFYRDWQIGTRAAQQQWVRQWWRDVWAGIKMQGRVYLGRLGI